MIMECPWCDLDVIAVSYHDTSYVVWTWTRMIGQDVVWTTGSLFLKRQSHYEILLPNRDFSLLILRHSHYITLPTTEQHVH